MESSTVLVDALERVIDAAGRAVLSTVDEEGAPQSRWMVAGMLRGAPGYIYAVTSPDSRKVREIRINPRVSWLLASEDFREVMSVVGDATIVDNPSLESVVLEAIGDRLATFWRVNAARGDVVVIETAVRAIDRLVPEQGKHDYGTVES